jgi:nicotinate phosphoribosyltransferase
MAYMDEEKAFQDFLRLFPDQGVLLVDTYDTMAAVEKIIQHGLRPSAIRLDSGNLLQLSQQIRKRLDKAGLQDTEIFASGDLDEYSIRELLEAGALIDSFGVGTALATSIDAPALSGVYKLVDLDSKDGISFRAKFSEQKTTYPGRKQVFRFHDVRGNYREDVIACEGEDFPDGEPLLRCVMHHGKRVEAGIDVAEVRARALREMEKIPPGCHNLENPDRYPVSFSERLESLLRLVRKRMKPGPSGRQTAQITA